MKKTSILSAAILMASMQLAANSADAKEAAKTKADPAGKCYGVVGKGEGECGGKNPKTGEAWSCAGQNPTADLGWKKMKQSECEAATKHAEATEKKFVANK